jgi:hypothetical protein
MTRIVWIAYSPEGWILDTCAGGTLTRDPREAKQWATPQECAAELAASDIGRDEFSIMEVIIEQRPAS